MSAPDPQGDPWTRYWSDGRVASCFDPGRGKYMPAVAGLWTGFFESLKPGARVLDVCTGNGALIYIAQDVRDDLALIGVDKAAIDPARHVTAADTSHAIFTGGVDAAALPFPDGSFDVVISQYGIEYAPRPAALREAMRLLAPGGSLRVLTHAAEGNVASGAPGQLAQTEALLESGLFAKARTAFTAMKQGAPDADAHIKAFHGAGHLLHLLAERITPSGIIRQTLDVLGHAWQAAAQIDESVLIAKVDELEAEAQAHDFRSRALADAALTRSEAEAWAEVLKTGGLIGVQLSEAGIADPKRHIGWIIEARRG